MMQYRKYQSTYSLNAMAKHLFGAMLCTTMCVACGGGGNPDSANESNLDAVSTDNTGIDNVTSSAADLLPDAEPVELPAAANAAFEYAAHLYIAQTQRATGLEVSSVARFHQFAIPLGEAPVLQTANNLDTCEIGSESSQLNAESLDVPLDHIVVSSEFDPIQTTGLSAGQTVALNSDGGSYITLVMDDGSAQSGQYRIEEGAVLNTEVPAQLNIDVPGDAFPALQWAWSKPALIDESLRPALRSVATDPVLVWQAAAAVANVTESHSKLQIYAGSIDELTGELTSFQCELADDGEFTLPQNVQALYANGFSPNFVNVARTTRTLQTGVDKSIVTVFVQRY